MKTMGVFFRIILAVCLPLFLCLSLTVSAALAKEGTAAPVQEDSASQPSVSEGASGEAGASLEESLDKGSDSAAPEAAEKEAGQAAQSATAAASAATTATDGDGGMGANISVSVPLANASISTGAATAQIPIIVPPGRGGIAPNLVLRYNSYQDNGWVGRGWNLDLGSIHLPTKYGCDYSDPDFVFEFEKDGSLTELVPRSDWGGLYFGATIEEEFTKFYYGSGYNTWMATAKDGTKYFYGTTDASKQIIMYCNYLTCTYGRVFAWRLDRVEDPNGNYMTISYTKDQGEIYLDRIDYTGNTSGLSTTNYVRFYLEDRPDVPVMYTSRAPVRTAKRLKTIEVVANGSSVRAYKLTYKQSEGTSRSLLASVQQFGDDATISGNGDITGGKALPAITLQYTPEAYALSEEAHWGTKANSASNIRMLADVNGDGKADFFYLNGNNLWVKLAENPGPGFIDNDIPAGTKTNSIVSMSGSYITSLADIDGDGKADFFYLNGNTLHVMLASPTGNGHFGSDTPWGTKSASISTSQGIPVWGLTDFDGDGRADFFYLNGNNLHVMFSRGAVGNTPPGFTSDVSSGTDAKTYGIGKTNSSTPVWGLADFNGDGMADFFYMRSGTKELHVMLATPTGNGRFGSDTLWGEMTYGIAAMLYGFADFNGDGKADFFYDRAGTYELHVLLSEGGCFEYDTVWGTINSDYSMVKSVPIWGLADFNGDGKADFFYLPSNAPSELHVKLSTGSGFGSETKWGKKTSGIAATSSNVPVWSLADVNGDGKADFFYQKSGSSDLQVVESVPDNTMLLSSLTNGRGSTTAIEYAHSSQYQNTLLPFIAHPVSQITIDDGLGNSSVETYSYQGGLYDFMTREFRGFAYVKRTNPDASIEETWFHQDEWRKGRQYQVDHSEPNGGPFISRAKLTWQTSPESPPAGTPAFVKLTQKRIGHYDNQNAETDFSQDAYTYNDDNGNLLTKVSTGTNGEQVTQTYEYLNYSTWLWRQTKETITGATSGKVRETSYDYFSGTGNLHYETHWLNPKDHQVPATDPRKEFLYDSYGNRTTESDANGNPPTTTTYETTAYTYPHVITYPTTNGVSHSVENEAYDYRYGKVTSKKDENGNHTYFAYDHFGRLQQIDYHPDGGQQVMEYYDNAFPRYMVTKVKENNGSYVDKYVYFDGLDREIQTITHGEGDKSIVTTKHYDPMGRIDGEHGPFFGAGVVYTQKPPEKHPYKKTIYDFRGRPVQITRPDPDGANGLAITTFVYSSGLATTTTDPDGDARTEWKDYLNRIIQVTEHADSDFNTRYKYNAAGDLLQVLDHAGNYFIMDYDTLGRKIDMTDPDMGYWVYTYDPNGNLHTQVDAKGQTITMEYDELNRIISKAYSTGDPAVKYTYDDPSVSNGKGRLASVSKTHATITYNAYDQMGRVQSLAKTIAGDQPRTTGYTYDLAGKILTTTYPDNYQVTNAYWPHSGLLATVTGSDSVVYATCFDYEPTGKMGQINHHNGTATRYSYDPQTTRLTGIATVTTDQTGNTVNDVQLRTYYYSPAGDIWEITDGLRGITYSYTYDRLHRLRTESNTGPYAPLTYTYNAIGNMMTRSVGGDTYSYAYDSTHKHAVKSITFHEQTYQYTYDPNGNMTSGPDFTDPENIATRTITYNANNMPRHIVHSQATVDFVYDGNGARARKQVQGGATTYYIGEHFEVKDGIATKYIFAGNLRVAMIKGQTVSYFHKDHLASSTVMTDATGVVVETTEYMPYGLERDYSGTWVSDYKYTDQELDTESGLYNYDARHYDPVIGRFISADSRVPDYYDPQTLNRYSYARNNPLIYVDPTGHFFGEFWNWLWGNGWTTNSVGPYWSITGVNMYGIALPSVDQNYMLNRASDITWKLMPNCTDSISSGIGTPGGEYELTAREKNFFGEFAPIIANGVFGKGILPSVAIAQGLHESDFGRTADISLFGIKGQGVRATTTEYINGRKEIITDSFAHFSSTADAVEGYVNFLQRYQRYANALSATDPFVQTAELQKAHYSTDENYAALLNHWIIHYTLTRYDSYLNSFANWQIQKNR